MRLASQVLDDPYYLEVVKTAHNWLLTEMCDPETGAFAGSQDADKEEAYYGQPLSVRAIPADAVHRPHCLHRLERADGVRAGGTVQGHWRGRHVLEAAKTAFTLCMPDGEELTA